MLYIPRLYNDIILFNYVYKVHKKSDIKIDSKHLFIVMAAML